jgi:hypothetical protein
MTDAAATPAAADIAPPIDLRILAGCLAAILVMTAAIVSRVPWFLNFVHVMAGVLWTGTDLFMGFVVGPVLRASPFEARRAVTMRLVPKTLFVLPTLAIITGTSGWYHAKQLGFLETPYPAFWWVAAALGLLAILTIQGLGVLLPTNLRVYFELRKPTPDRERIVTLMRAYIFWISVQGLCQVAMIVVMARFVTGL